MMKKLASVIFENKFGTIERFHSIRHDENTSMSSGSM